jgi:hypothetical protein
VSEKLPIKKGDLDITDETARKKKLRSGLLCLVMSGSVRFGSVAHAVQMEETRSAAMYL